MDSGQADRVTVAVVRAWTEGQDERLKIRVTRVTVLGAAAHESSVVASIDDACALLRRWLEAFVATDAPAAK